MKKIISLIILSISLTTLSCKAFQPGIDSLTTSEESRLLPKVSDTLIYDVASSVIEGVNNLIESTPKSDSLAVQNADVIVQAVSSFVPVLKPYTSILGFLCTTIGYTIIHFKWRRRHKKELEALIEKQNG